MAKRKAKKKSPPSSSRPPPSCPTRQVASGPSSPTRKLARHFSLPTLSRVVDLAIPMQLSGPNWLPELCSVSSAPVLVASGPILAASGAVPPGLAAAGSSQVSDATPSLAALGNHGVDQTPSSTPPQPPCPKLLISENSPSFSELFAPIVLDSPGDSETDGSSAYNSDSNSHYGSPVLVSSELRGRHPSPVSSAPTVAEGPSETPAAPLQLIHYAELIDSTTCEILNDDLDCACDVWKSCLIGYVSGRFPGFRALKSMIVNTWRCEAVLEVHDSGWLIYKFRNEVDRLAVLKGGPYLVFGRPLILKEMPEFFYFNPAEMSTVPVWIKLPNLPLRCWSLKYLSKLASIVGKPLQSDMLTSSMSRLSYARVLVELDLRKPLREHIDVKLPNGEIIVQQVIYETLPKFCSHCHIIGHTVDSCSKVPRKVGVNQSQAAAAPVPPSSFSAEKAVLSLEGAASVHALVSPLIDKDLQHPMVCEAASGLQDWQPVPKKHTSNRQPKISSDLTALTLQQGKSVAEVGYATGGADLSGMGGNAAGSARVMCSGGSVVQLVGAGPQALSAAVLGPGSKPGSKGVLGGAPVALQRVIGRARPTKAFERGGRTGKDLQSTSQLSCGHGRNLPATTAP
ncbi:hypothetical protein OIU76_028432 [Salix suchowensis]|nr:hypothetical protein OIU76_028432 [Salix suchowensis]